MDTSTTFSQISGRIVNQTIVEQNYKFEMIRVQGRCQRFDSSINKW